MSMGRDLTVTNQSVVSDLTGTQQSIVSDLTVIIQ